MQVIVYGVLTKCFQAGSLVTVKAPPPFFLLSLPFFHPPLTLLFPSLGGKIPAGTSTVDLNSGIVVEKQNSAKHAGGFPRMFFFILFRKPPC
ncbi:hypothetical protein R3I94_000713 [Phoxinus phoxinus]|uniref:Uncharacterized protein n=1 Tax=Phoxinus phoxinus TaxID=58324 RepID=A0AAN9HHZ4_9TELE